MLPGSKPLAGKSILVTRERSQAAALSQPLSAQGAIAIECPLIAFSPPADWAPVDRCLQSLSEYHGVLFTSANAVEFTFGRMEETGIPLDSAQRIAAYAVGPATAEALAARGITVNSLPDHYQAEGLASLLAKETVREKRFLFPRARKAREWLPRFLEEKGARVDVAVVYETRKAVENEAKLRKVLEEGKPDYLTFTSSSTVEAFVELAGSDPKRREWQSIPAACIGEITADTARSKGFLQVLTARPSTISGLVQAVVDHVEGRR